MPKGAETRLAYKASVTGGELKIQYFGLVASGQVKTVEEAVRGLVAGEACVFVACRHDVRVKLIDSYSQALSVAGEMQPEG